MGKAKRITVIIPFLYEGRQHRRSARESLDCAMALQELVSMGVAQFSFEVRNHWQKFEIGTELLSCNGRFGCRNVW